MLLYNLGDLQTVERTSMVFIIDEAQQCTPGLQQSQDFLTEEQAYCVRPKLGIDMTSYIKLLRIELALPLVRHCRISVPSLTRSGPSAVLPSS